MLTSQFPDNHTITDTYIDLINEQRRLNFGDDFSGDFSRQLEMIYALLLDNDTVKAFGTLLSVDLTHHNTSYKILGIGNVVAIEKGHGYGKHLMIAIRNYLASQNIIGIGFCEPRLSKFYRACGYTVIKNISDRFHYSSANIQKDHEALDVLCYTPNNEFIRSLQTDKTPIHINQPIW